MSPLPIGTPATDKSIIPSYTTYFYDTWHMKPTFTLTYGLGWNLEMPPYELQGKQVELVDSNNQAVVTSDFIAQRQAAALQGGSYTPTLGYTLVRNVGSGPKYPYNPYYGEFSPRASFAWNPRYNDGILGKIFGNGKTVIRGGYGRIFGRLNGVDLVLVPLLGPGLLQGVTCVNPLMSGTCAGSGVATPANAFRIGTGRFDGAAGLAFVFVIAAVLSGIGNESGKRGCQHPGPALPAGPYGSVSRSPCSARSTGTCNSKWATAARSSRNEFVEVNLDSVPYMETLNGQSFATGLLQRLAADVLQQRQPG